MNKAIAYIKGSAKYPNIYGVVTFEESVSGILVTTQVYNLPSGDFFGFHIHEGTECINSFSSALDHLNPNNSDHPFHMGDLPPLMSSNGYTYMQFFTNKFTLNDILEKVIIIHEMSDDFTTQPSGKSGDRIACGKIYLV